MNQELVLSSDNKVYKYISEDGFEGYVPVTIPQAQPWLSWKGPRFALEEWRKVMRFFAWSHDKTGGETQARFYVNHETDEIKAWVWPQKESSGLITHELSRSEMDAEVGARYDDQSAQFGPPWQLLGTIHHHCKSEAFQSGTDTANEVDQGGLHVTLGNLDREEWSFHSRVYLRKQKYGVRLIQWFETPIDDITDLVPWESTDSLVKFHLTKAPTKEEWNADDAFPGEWKENLIENKTVTVYTGTGKVSKGKSHSRYSSHYSYGHGYGMTYGEWDDKDDVWPDEKAVGTDKVVYDKEDYKVIGALAHAIASRVFTWAEMKDFFSKPNKAIYETLLECDYDYAHVDYSMLEKVWDEVTRIRNSKVVEPTQVLT